MSQYRSTATYSITDVYRDIPVPVVAVAAHVDGHDHAMVASSFLAVSDEPPLVSVSIKDGSTSWPVLRRAQEVGISVLTAEHSGLLKSAWRKSSHERLEGTDVRADGDALLLENSPTALTCDVVDEIRVGDHTFVVLRVRTVTHRPEIGQPIVHHNHRVTALTTGEQD